MFLWLHSSCVCEITSINYPLRSRVRVCVQVEDGADHSVVANQKLTCMADEKRGLQAKVDMLMERLSEKSTRVRRGEHDLLDKNDQLTQLEVKLFTFSAFPLTPLQEFSGCQFEKSSFFTSFSAGNLYCKIRLKVIFLRRILTEKTINSKKLYKLF